jgi:hypothetical protein
MIEEEISNTSSPARMGSNCQPVYVADPKIASIISIYSPPGAALWDDERKYYTLKDEAQDTMTEKDAIGPLLSELRPHRYAVTDILVPFAIPSCLHNQGCHSIARADATAKPLTLAAKFIAYSLLKSCFITLRSLIYLSGL